MLFKDFWFGFEDPAARWYRDGEDLVIEMDLPGYKREEIRVTVEDNKNLRIRAENEKRGVTSKYWTLKNRTGENVSSTFVNGVLEVRVKAKDKEIRQVQIE
jgi:HSP20 family molecular chaperone IbpA